MASGMGPSSGMGTGGASIYEPNEWGAHSGMGTGGADAYEPNSNGPKNSSMPLDDASQIALRQAAAARNTFLSGLNQQHQDTRTNYQDSLYDLNFQHPYDEQSLLNNYASRGMAFSSGYGDSRGELDSIYGTNLDRLRAAKAQEFSKEALARQNYNNEYGLSLESIRQAAAARLAGTDLGLGHGTNLAKLLQGIG